MKNIFKRLLNVKGMVVEDVSIDDSPLRDAPVLVARVRCRKAALRCSRCGRKCPKYDDGGGERCLCSMVLRPVERLVFSPKER